MTDQPQKEDLAASRVNRHLRALSKYLGRSVILLAAHWQEPWAVDFDEHALHILDAVLPSNTQSELAVICLGRGGHLAFADGLRRRLGAYEDVTSIALDVVEGAMTFAMLSGRCMLFRRQAALGAFDAGPQGQVAPSWSHALLPHVDRGLMAQLSPEHAQRVVLGLAQQTVEQKHARFLLHRMFDARKDTCHALSESLSTAKLPHGVGLEPSVLKTMGLDARIASSSQQALLDKLYSACDEVLTLRKRVAPRYTQSSILEEAEFDLTSTHPGGLIMSERGGFVFNLDSGLPDPDTELLGGQWAEVQLS